MNKYVKYILIIALVTAVSFGLQVGWIAIVEPIMESNGIAFGGIIGTGNIISAVFIYVIHIVAAIVLALMFKGNIPIGMCCLYNVIYFALLLIYSPGRLYYSDVDNKIVSALIISASALVVEVIPFAICKLCQYNKKNIAGEKGGE